MISMWYVTARKIVSSKTVLLRYGLVHCPAKLSSNNFGTIFTIFAKSQYYFYVDKSAIILKYSRNKE